MRMVRLGSVLVFVLSLVCGIEAQDLPATSSQSPPTNAEAATVAPAQSSEPQPPAAVTLNDVLNRMVQREHFFMAQMRHLHPMVETYLQDLKNDSTGNPLPVKDQYFLGRLDLSDGPEDVSFMGQPGFGRRVLEKMTGAYSLHFLPLGFAQMVVLDTDFQKRYYDFSFVRREFLGEIRCLVIDVKPKPNQKVARFMGRIWVEDQDYNIVRFNGTYYPQPKINFFFHFDSWRLNMRPGTWLPAYVYTEESNLKTGWNKTLHFKAQTRLWGYDLKGLGRNNEEFTQILIDSPQSVKDQSDAAADATPVMAQRMWERQAEENAVDHLEKVGLLAPSGDVDKILATVVNNLLVTNNIDLQGDIHCRVLLTAPLESFTIGHTIVISRGLLDVLPDEASLAMVLAHELSHIVLGHSFDTQLAFNDRLFFPDQDSFRRLDFKRNSADEEAADTKALELLKNSPYKDKLANAGLFLKALQEKAPDLPNLIRPHLGNSFAGSALRMASLVSTAPALDDKRLDQIAALPLGGRIKVDPWTDRAELSKAKPVALISAREKMEFQITPVFPYLTRFPNGNAEKVALTNTPPTENTQK